jgi:DNA primase
VAIPVYGYPRDANANALAYLGRWPGDDFDEDAGRPRYKWPDGFTKSRVVFGLHEALDGTDGQPLVVVEGPFSVFRLAQAGIRSAVAIFGSSLSDEQADLLATNGRRIVLMFDGDEAGQSGMRLAAAKLIRRTFLRVIQLPEGAQPDTLSDEAFASVLAVVKQ